MNTKIKSEEIASRKFNFDVIPDAPNLLDLSIKNVALVEAMIRIDSKYCRSSDKTAGPIKGSYEGSTAYWMTKLKDFYASGKILKSDEYHEIIKNAVCAVDRENSTHLNSDINKGGGRDVIVKRIESFEKNYVLESLRKRSFDFVDKIASKTSKESGARTNPSFASKFCHYACMYLFEGRKEQDNFSIYDGILREVLPCYAKYYEIECIKRMLKHNSKGVYCYYSQLVDAILKKSGSRISRNGFDHLLWYYYKGRDLSATHF